MNAIEKFITLKNKFCEFVNGFESEFVNIKEASSKFCTNSNGDIALSVKALKELSDLALSTVKKKKDETFIEKTKVTQQIMNQYSSNGMSASYDVSNNLRNLIQKNINHFELSYNETANKFSKPIIGTLWVETNEWLNYITESTLQKTHRSHEVQLSIATATIENIFANLRNNLEIFAEKDIAILTQKIQQIQQEVSEYLKSCSMPDFKFVTSKFEFSDKYDQLITSCLRFEMPYQGNYTKRNFRSMIFEMRSFSMMFLLLLSSFGINRYIAQDEKSRTIVSVISLVLVVIGILVTFANAQDSKEDRLEDELKKAKDRMNTEIKRAVNEFMSEWKNFMFSTFKTEMADISAETDKLIREDTKKKNENVIMDRLKLNQLSQILDAKDRNYQDLIRKCESWKQQIDSLEGEIQRQALTINI